MLLLASMIYSCLIHIAMYASNRVGCGFGGVLISMIDRRLCRLSQPLIPHTPQSSAESCRIHNDATCMQHARASFVTYPDAHFYPFVRDVTSISQGPVTIWPPSFKGTTAWRGAYARSMTCISFVVRGGNPGACSLTLCPRFVEEVLPASHLSPTTIIEADHLSK
jgi:hypothetical protein